MASSLTTEILGLVGQGRLLDAAASISAAMQERPDDPEVSRMGAVVLWKGGDVEAAQTVLQELLTQYPEDADALRLLGGLQMEGNRAMEAATTYGQLCALPCAGVRDHVNWAESLIAKGHFESATRILEDLLPLAREFPEVRLQLADAYLGEERVDDALILLESAKEDDPDDLAVLAGLTQLYVTRGRRSDAQRMIMRFTDLQPDNPKAWLERARFHHALHEYPAALTALGRALELAPKDPQVHHQIGDLYVRLKAYHLAEQHYRFVMDLAPERRDDAESCIAVARFNQGDIEGAEAILKAVLARDPRSFPARRGLTFVYDNTMRHQEVLDIYDEFLRSNKGNVGLHYNRCFSLLRLGRLKEGWAEWENRFKIGLRGIESDQPRWEGQFLDGQRLLVMWEQGYGDTIQCARFLPLLRAFGGRTILVCQRGLKRLIERSCLVDEVEEVRLGDPNLPEHDYAVSLMSLPHILGIDLENLPAKVPYLEPDPELIRLWGERMRVDRPGLRVGLVWSGSPTHGNDPNRSCPTEKLKLLAGIPGIRWFSLLRGPDVGQLNELQADLDIEEYGSQFSDFDDTAGALMNMDLLISVDTSVAHLGGALAKPVWLLLPVCADWRWMAQRQDSPWYPTVRLFRQPKYQDWDSVFQSVRSELVQMVERTC